MASVDTSAWPRVGGTAAGGYYEVEPDILVAAPHDGFEQTPEAAEASLQELYRIARERGRKPTVIVLVDAVRTQDAASRRVWARMDPALCAGYSLVCSTMLAQAIGSFFVGLNRPQVSLRMFNTFEDALEWARTMREEHGGPIGA